MAGPADARDDLEEGGSMRRAASEGTAATSTSVSNPDVCNPDVCNPDVCNPDLCNPDLCNPDLCDPDACNPDVSNPDVSADALGVPPDAAGAPARRVGRELRDAVQDLPSLMDRIEAMGLSAEYVAYRERYLGWRQGKGQGAQGELQSSALRDQNCIRPQFGFGYWYPTIEEWQWKRTLSFWISVTFFEGAILFTCSSFLTYWSRGGGLGCLTRVMTQGGIIAGKVFFFATTYLMCLETINLPAASHAQGRDDAAERGPPAPPGARRRRGFKLWPFHARTALRNLDAAGAGPWPYVASAVYLIGVITFAVGLVPDFAPAVAKAFPWFGRVCFLFGAIFFTAGGIAECVENEVFISFSLTTGWVGAVLNTLGGLGYLVGAVLYCWPELNFCGSFAFGVGSAIFITGSGLMIMMWKDEQFGLTFMAALNRLGGPTGRPMVKRDGSEQAEETKTLSACGACFIMIYCFAGAMSTFDFLIVFAAQGWHASTLRLACKACSALMPLIFAHMMLALSAGVYEPPGVAPFRHLFLACRGIALIMAANSALRVCQAVAVAGDPTYGPC